jgi:hypothetical protein
MILRTAAACRNLSQCTALSILMTVMIDSFFGVHPHLLRSGLWTKMKPGEKNLYLFLMEESERRCTRELTATDAQITVAVGTASRTLCNARKKLQEHGLIRYKAGHGNRYRYVICDPKTGEPYPGDPRQPLVVPKRKAQATSRPKPDVADTSPHSLVASRLESTSPSDQQKLPIRTDGVSGIFP